MNCFWSCLRLARAVVPFGVAVLIANGSGLLGASPDYERDIKPLLRERCYSCHSGVKQKGGLRLDAGALIHKGGEDGPAIVAGRSGKSPLVKRVLSHDDDERMPPEGKPLPPDKIALLQRWIDGGAAFPKDEIVPPTPASHWAFRAVESPPVPMLKEPARARNPIDSFVLSALERRNWKPAPGAEPRALLRRVYLDLTGLPPTPAEQERFSAAPSAEALDGVIDDLLARPAYGERWARHWLDVVRYADTNGYERDAEKPFVWRYRDYVISALNADKPYDRFVLEQLAGDEMPDASAETAVATTYLRLGHWDDEPADPQADRFDQLDDIVSTTAQAFLGLTLGCARCHDHKFEPLTARDYYGMVAVFNPLERPRNGRTELAVPAGSPAQIAALAERDRAIAELKKQEKSLAPDVIEQRIRSLREATPDTPKAYTLREPSAKPPDTYVLLRGSPAQRGAIVLPSVPAVLSRRQPDFPPSGEHTSQRRLGLAQWIASPGNPLTARVIVNRVWQQHFGQGLVRTPSDFGLMGEPPTHPELLDWLAHWFMHDAGWSLKKLHRLILTSNTWRMSRQTNPEYAASDPENRLLWRMPLRRLEVEPIRDSMLAVSGSLNRKMFGPAMKPRIQQAAIEANTDKEKSWSASDESETARRTIYAFIKRGLVVPMLEVLDLGDTVSSCPKRLVTTVAPQALTLFNGEFVNEQARHFAKRLQVEAGPDLRWQIALAWRLTLCRPPTEKELATMLSFRNAEGSALEQICRVILNLNEFAYPE
jgi:hypothetical protein